MEGGITLRALTGDLDIAQTGGQRKATHGTTSDLVKARHFRRPRALARPLGLRPPFFPLLAGIVLVAVLSILLAHISSGFIVSWNPASPREWLEQEWMNGPSLRQLSTRIFQTRDIDGLASRIHSTNDALLVNEKGGSPGDSSFLVQHSVRSAYFLFPIAQQCELRSDFFGELFLSRPGIDAHCKDFRVVLLKIVDIRLISL